MSAVSLVYYSIIGCKRVFFSPPSSDVSNLNAFIDADESLQDKSLEYIMLNTEGTIFNNAGQVSYKTLGGVREMKLASSIGFRKKQEELWYNT